jgi:hypothetical protein
MTASTYETSNVYLASFLFRQGATLDGFTRPSARRVVYRFLADEKLHELLRLYWGNFPLPIVAASLFAAVQQLKKLVRRRPAKVISLSSLALPADPVSPTQPC